MICPSPSSCQAQASRKGTYQRLGAIGGAVRGGPGGGAEGGCGGRVRPTGTFHYFRTHVGVRLRQLHGAV
eukprot:437666-Prymnesium_polylepis.1